MRRSVLALVIVSLLSLAARAAFLGAPCQGRCRHLHDHVLVFDEAYYVNAARTIAGIRVPDQAHYASTPLGDDPNAEHPQGVKLVMAGLIEVLGDGPLAWRLGSLIAGSLAILGMWWLARAAGAGPGESTVAAALMAADNLMLVAGRIGILDIYAVCAVVWALAMYLRGRYVTAGVLIALGIACKEVAVFGLLVAGLYEALAIAFKARTGQRWQLSTATAARHLGVMVVVGVGGFIGLLAAMDRVAPPFDDAAGRLVGGGVFGHIAHMIGYGVSLTSPHGPAGIASYPVEWLVDLKPIVYLAINPAQPAAGLSSDHPAVLFLGMISPPILLAGLVGLVVAGFRLGRQRGTRLERLAMAWFAGTWVPFELLSLIWQRTSYLYYMLIVMPGLYLAAAAALARWRRHRRAMAVWVGAVVLALIVMYPLNPVTPRL